MRVRLSTMLRTSPDQVWNEVQTSRLLRYVAAPMLHFRSVDPAELPVVWLDGAYKVRVLAFGWLPFGHQTIRISRSVTGTTRVLRDNGSGQLASVWDHTISVQSSASGATQYTDEVEVRAGILTPFVWMFAQLFYRHRQRRWRALVKCGFRYSET